MVRNDLNMREKKSITKTAKSKTDGMMGMVWYGYGACKKSFFFSSFLSHSPTLLFLFLFVLFPCNMYLVVFVLEVVLPIQALRIPGVFAFTLLGLCVYKLEQY